MKKKIWGVIALLLAVFLVLGVVQGVRHPERVGEGLTIIGGYELDFSEESGDSSEDSENSGNSDNSDNSENSMNSENSENSGNSMNNAESGDAGTQSESD